MSRCLFTHPRLHTRSYLPAAFPRLGFSSSLLPSSLPLPSTSSSSKYAASFFLVVTCSSPGASNSRSLSPPFASARESKMDGTACGRRRLKNLGRDLEVVSGCAVGEGEEATGASVPPVAAWFHLMSSGGAWCAQPTGCEEMGRIRGTQNAIA